MEQRLKSLEDLCELITKEIVQQNKNIIEVNKIEYLFIYLVLLT
jgi:uncharacterized Rmd1/YagE family protein